MLDGAVRSKAMRSQRAGHGVALLAEPGVRGALLDWLRERLARDLSFASEQLADDPRRACGASGRIGGWRGSRPSSSAIAAASSLGPSSL